MTLTQFGRSTLIAHSRIVTVALSLVLAGTTLLAPASTIAQSQSPPPVDPSVTRDALVKSTALV
jgi:hypothetical protein